MGCSPWGQRAGRDEAASAKNTNIPFRVCAASLSIPLSGDIQVASMQDRVFNQPLKELPSHLVGC